MHLSHGFNELQDLEVYFQTLLQLHFTRYAFNILIFLQIMIYT